MLNWGFSSLDPFLWCGRFRFPRENGHAARYAWAPSLLQQTPLRGAHLEPLSAPMVWLDNGVQAIYPRKRDFNRDSLYKILMWIIKFYLREIFLVSDLTSKASKQGGISCPVWSILAWVCYEFIDKVFPLLILNRSVERQDQLPGELQQRCLWGKRQRHQQALCWCTILCIFSGFSYCHS